MTSKKSSFNAKYVFLIVICLAYLVASLINAEKATLAFKNFLIHFFSFLPIFVVMMIMMQLVQLFVHKKDLISKLKKISGKKQKFVYILAGIFSMGPLYVWFPLLKNLKDKNISMGNLASFIYARSIKPIFFPVLFYYFDWKYILSLFISLFIFALIQGFVVDYLLEK
jgi:uncharacterized membrane protein YraQ (UPF0718 family)